MMTQAIGPQVEELVWPGYVEIMSIKHGVMPLSAFIPDFKNNFDTYIKTKTYAVDEFTEGASRLQNAINNRIIYRKEKTW